MWRALMSSRFASWVVGMVSMPKARQQQQELDFQRLYILTQLYKASAQGKSANMAKLLLESQALEPSSIQREVQTALQSQVVGAAQALHDVLQQAGDPSPAAAALAAAHWRLLRRRERNASGLSKLLAGLRRGHGSGGRVPGERQPPGAAPLPAPGGGIDGGGGTALTQSQLATALQQRIGFRLELRPSSVPHPEAGTGLFIRGEARPGTVVAIFPGVLYGRTQLAHMPNYPKVDTENPYLSCRYDQSIVDSKPWGRGDPGVAPPAAACTIADAATRQHDNSASCTTSDAGGDGVGASCHDSAAAPAAAAAAGGNGGGDRLKSDGSSRSGVSSGGGDLDSASSCSSGNGSSSRGGGQWWSWAGPLSAALGHLEGRHPLALGHFVNHPGAGQSPNVLEAAVDLPLDHPSLDAAAARPWLRAYLPTLQPPLHYDPYGKDGEPDDDEDEAEHDGEEDVQKDAKPEKRTTMASTGAAEAEEGRLQRRRQPRPPPGQLPAEALLTPPGGVVRLLVLVAARGLRDGEELLQNYRMNPHVGRPEWYVVHDAEAEQRRWAKVRALDLGFKARGGGGGSGSGAAAGH